MQPCPVPLFGVSCTARQAAVPQFSGLEVQLAN